MAQKFLVVPCDSKQKWCQNAIDSPKVVVLRYQLEEGWRVGIAGFVGTIEKYKAWVVSKIYTQFECYKVSVSHSLLVHQWISTQLS